MLEKGGSVGEVEEVEVEAEGVGEEGLEGRIWVGWLGIFFFWMLIELELVVLKWGVVVGEVVWRSCFC